MAQRVEIDMNSMRREAKSKATRHPAMIQSPREIQRERIEGIQDKHVPPELRRGMMANSDASEEPEEDETLERRSGEMGIREARTRFVQPRRRHEIQFQVSYRHECQDLMCDEKIMSRPITIKWPHNERIAIIKRCQWNPLRILSYDASCFFFNIRSTPIYIIRSKYS